MSGRFHGKVTIITGSSNGIGKETALLFAKEGAKVTVTGRNLERLDALKQKLLDLNIPESNFLVVPADITTSSGQDELIGKTLEKFGRLDILWTVLAYYPMAKAAIDQYTRTAAIDLIGEGIRVNAVNPGFIKTGFHESELGWTPEEAKKFYQNMGANRSAIPCGFAGRPEHIAEAIAFLADHKTSEFIVGQNIVVDGGTTMVLGVHAGVNDSLVRTE
ncbi:hypothetical protein CRE_02477 [Caenorhabditis remanei]|uniref:Uncharacterized protein n=2 Tax=Caenorhabditis remanei TaxID=31234 RepID=E3MWQ9_CAERE|nr:hypothetical protein CRE_02477 [Caenorhabditis remanei]